MARVLVLGGNGFYGRAVVDALAQLDQVTVATASRSTSPRVDLTDPSTFDALDDADLVVNASDAVGAPPDDAMRHVLGRGGRWLDLGADPQAIERTLERLDGAMGAGTVALGGGIFPGVSTALAAEAARRVGEVVTLELGVRISPFSGAGPANVKLMTSSLDQPRVSWVGGLRRAGPPIEAGAPFPAPGGGEMRTLGLALGDAPLLHSIAPKASVSAGMALKPDVMRHSFAATGWLLRLLGPLRGLVLVPMGWQLGLMRGLLFRGVESAVDIAVVANRDRGNQVVLTAHAPQGRPAMGHGAAAFAEQLLGGGLPSGVVVGGAHVDVAQMVTTVHRRFGPGSLQVTGL